MPTHMSITHAYDTCPYRMLMPHVYILVYTTCLHTCLYYMPAHMSIPHAYTCVYTTCLHTFLYTWEPKRLLIFWRCSCFDSAAIARYTKQTLGRIKRWPIEAGPDVPVSSSADRLKECQPLSKPKDSLYFSHCGKKAKTGFRKMLQHATTNEMAD